MAQELEKLGVNNVVNLKGSIFAWADAGLPLVNQAGTTRAVHSFDKHWGQLLNETVPSR
jgi:3-mercaptopyruvate sulfurtransferase SseA